MSGPGNHNPSSEIRGIPETLTVRQKMRLATTACAVGLLGLTLLLLVDASPIDTLPLENRSASPQQAIGSAAVGIDPNTASWAELALLPGLGESVAKRIIEYRSIQTSNDGRPVFARPEDLLPIKGIGEKTLNRMRQFLRFDEATAPD